jgi:hypothetical protein
LRALASWWLTASVLRGEKGVDARVTAIGAKALSNTHIRDDAAVVGFERPKVENPWAESS